METKEFTREQLDVLAGLVLAEASLATHTGKP